MTNPVQFMKTALGLLGPRKHFVVFTVLSALALLVGVWMWRTSRTAVFYAGHRLHNDRITGLAFTGNGQWLISAGLDGKVIAWDVRSKQAVSTLWSHSSPVCCLAVDKDAKVLAAGSSDGLIKVWELPEMQERVSVRIGSTAVLALAISPLDGSIVAYCDDKKLRMWKQIDGREPTVLKENVNILGAMAFSDDGRLLAIGSWVRGAAVVLNMQSRTEVVLEGKSRVFKCVGFVGDTHLVAGDEAEVWDADSGSEIGRLAELGAPPPHGRNATAMITGPKGRGLVAGDGYGMIYLYDATASKLLGSFYAFDAGVTALAVSSDGTMLAAGCTDFGFNDRPGYAEVKVWKLPSSYSRQ